MKLTTDQLKTLIVTQLLKEPGVITELEGRHGGHFPAGYLDPNNWTRHKKCKLKSIDEEEDKIGFDFISARPYNGDFYHEYSTITFPLTCRIFICMQGGKDYRNLPEAEWPDDTTLIVLTDAKDENVIAFGFSCD